MPLSRREAGPFKSAPLSVALSSPKLPFNRNMQQFAHIGIREVLVLLRRGPKSVEQIVRRSLWRLVFWRIMGDVAAIPRRVLECLAKIAGEFEMAVFYLELDAARRYEALTDVDLGVAAGEATRYEGLH